MYTRRCIIASHSKLALIAAGLLSLASKAAWAESAPALAPAASPIDERGPSGSAPAAPASGLAPAGATASNAQPAVAPYASADRGSSVARAPSEPRLADRVAFGMRLGYASPSGSAWEQLPIEEMTEGVLFVQGDLHYALTPNWIGGVYGALGIGSSGDSVSDYCDATSSSCTVFKLDVGIQGEFRPAPGATIQPWVGAALGFDLLSQSVDYGSYSVSYNIYGPAVAASTGIDVDTGRFVVGPYIDYKVGWYTSVDVTADDESSIDGEIDDVAMHRWFTIGVRGSHGIGG